MKRFLFFLALCIGSSANAATMCAPDLSSCTSCSDTSYSGVSWTATYWPVIYYGTISGHNTGLSYDSCAQACADKFFPSAAFRSRPLGNVPGCEVGGSS